MRRGEKGHSDGIGRIIRLVDVGMEECGDRVSLTETPTPTRIPEELHLSEQLGHN